MRLLQDIHEKLDTLGESVSQARQATNLINSLNSRYTPMIRTIQTWASTAPQLYTVQQILSTLQQDDVRDEVNSRKRGEPLGGGTPDIGGRHANYGGAGPSGRSTPGSQNMANV